MDVSVISEPATPGASSAGASVPGRPGGQCLVFEVGGSRFGLWSSVVREVVRAVSVSVLPGAPPSVLGVINVRGRVVPVFSLRERLQLGVRPVEAGDYFIVALAGRRMVALHVDRAVGLLDVGSWDEAVGIPETVAAPQVVGVVQYPDGLALIHDPATFLSIDETATLDESLADAR